MINIRVNGEAAFVVGVMPGSASGGQGPGRISGAGVCGSGRCALLLLSLESGCSLMFFLQLHSGLFGAVCCFASAAPVRVGCFLLLPAAWGIVRVLPFCVAGPRSWAGSPSWSVPFGVFCCCLRCYTYSHYCVSL